MKSLGDNMFVYKVTFINGSILFIRANSPNEAEKRALKVGEVKFIKYSRG